MEPWTVKEIASTGENSLKVTLTRPGKNYGCLFLQVPIGDLEKYKIGDQFNVTLSAPEPAKP